ncbi:hypothetical protein E4U16_004016 [Claviceps sp. LM84 group G4]|nr:hypothetical protein E4U16_004016 [Claviceps sp. LM84 group G4]KAG6086276.1 hypothetical protein E4U33_006774 [Claviceps sp. LM78 group G4]
MTPLGSKRPAPMAEQLATAEPDDHGRIHLTLKRQKYVLVARRRQLPKNTIELRSPPRKISYGIHIRWEFR